MAGNGRCVSAHCVMMVQHGDNKVNIISLFICAQLAYISRMATAVLDSLLRMSGLEMLLSFVCRPTCNSCNTL